MPARLYAPAEFTPMPWRNGKGATVELCREDDAAGEMLWRLSAADVVEDGEFSVFPGIDRVLVLTDGPGFRLDFGANGRAAVQPLEPVWFSGDWTTRAEGVRGASRDFNVMVARGKAKADVHVHRTGGKFSPAHRSLFYALTGAWTVGGNALPAGHLLMLAGGIAGPGAIHGSGGLIEVALSFSTR